MNALVINHLTVAYQSMPVLWNVSASIDKGVMMAIVGPNGAGKSTLLKAVLGLVKPLSGTVEYFGSLRPAPGTIAYVPQRSSVDWDFPIQVRDVVLMGSYARLGWFTRPGRAERDQADSLIDAIGLSAFADHQIGELSGGQQQRVFLARALMQRSPLLLLDEPFNGIDEITERIMLALLRKEQEEGTTIIAVHHDLTTVQQSFDWAMILNHSVVACGPIPQVFTPPLIQQAFGSSHHPTVFTR